MMEEMKQDSIYEKNNYTHAMLLDAQVTSGFFFIFYIRNLAQATQKGNYNEITPNRTHTLISGMKGIRAAMAVAATKKSFQNESCPSITPLLRLFQFVQIVKCGRTIQELNYYECP